MRMNMKQNKLTMYTHKQSGFSIVELFLVVSVTALTITGLFSLINTAINDRVDADVGFEMKELQIAAEDYVVLNFTDILNTIPAEGDITEVTIPNLQAQSFLPAAYTGINAYNQQMRIYVRHVDNDAASGNVLEVLTVSLDQVGADNRMATDRILNAANKAGSKVGTLTNLDISATCCQNTFVGSSKTWFIDTADFAASAPPYISAANNNGGYMAAYGRVTNPDFAAMTGYLFREAIPGDPTANIMETNLDMNGHQLSNAGAIVTDSINIADGNDVTIIGNNTNTIQSPYVLAIEGHIETNNLFVGHDNSLSSGKGNLFIDGDSGGSAVDLVTNNINVNNQNGNSFIISNEILDDVGMSLNITDQINFSELTTNGPLTTNNTIIADETIFNGSQLSTSGNMQIYEISGTVGNLVAGAIGVEHLNIADNAQINAPMEAIEPLNFPGNLTAGTITSRTSTNISVCRETGGGACQ